jgi:hypothetical protein
MMDALMIAIALGLLALAIAYAHAIRLPTPMPSKRVEEKESWFLTIRSRRSLPSACCST